MHACLPGPWAVAGWHEGVAYFGVPCHALAAITTRSPALSRSPPPPQDAAAHRRTSSCSSDAGAGAGAELRKQLLTLQQEVQERDAVNFALQEHCNHLKERLADAVREKVEALLLAADAATAAAGERAAAGRGSTGGGDGTGSAKASSGGGAAPGAGAGAVGRAAGRDAGAAPTAAAGPGAATDQSPKAQQRGVGAAGRVWLTSW
jgi:hypothetical protein